MATGERQIACGRCGAEFTCGLDSAAGCWCASEPYRLPMPPLGQAGATGDCLCPSCLRAMAQMLTATKPSSA